MLSVISAARTSADTRRRWEPGAREAGIPLHSLLLQHWLRAAAPHLQRPGSAPVPRARPGSAWRSAPTRTGARPSPRAAASRLQSEQPRAGGRGPRAHSPPERLRGAAAAGAAGLPPARVTCAERGSPASPPRRGGAGPRARRKQTQPRAHLRAPAAPRLLRRRPAPTPAAARGRGQARSARRPRSRCGPSRRLGGTSGERLPAGPRLRRGAVSGASSVALPPHAPSWSRPLVPRGRAREGRSRSGMAGEGSAACVRARRRTVRNRLRDVGLLSLEKRRLRRDLINKYGRKGAKRMGPSSARWCGAIEREATGRDRCSGNST